MASSTAMVVSRPPSSAGEKEVLGPIGDDAEEGLLTENVFRNDVSNGTTDRGGALATSRRRGGDYPACRERIVRERIVRAPGSVSSMSRS